MTTGLISRFIASLALASAVFAPIAPAYADSLQSEFDQAFLASSAQAKPRFQAPAKVKPRLQPSAEFAQRALPPSVRQFIAAPRPSSYASPLEAQIFALADSGRGRIGVAAIDLSTGRTVSVLGDTPFPMASTSKIAIASTFLDAVDHGRLSLTTSYPLMVPVKSRKYSTLVAPVRAGAMLTGQRLIERSLIHSDNQATDALLAAVGGPPAVNRWLRASGVAGLRLDRDIATLVRDDGEYDPARMIDQRDSATPKAMAQLLSGIYQGRWLTSDSRAFLLATMEQCVTGRHRMRSQLPSDARIAHKTGTLSNTSSDVGLIQTADGRVYAVAIYVTGQGGHSGRDAKIAGIARTLYDGYAGENGAYRVAVQH
jgi:beta-lactamase class A